MALEAAIQALNFVQEKGGGKTKVFVEDEYVKNGITGWIFRWKRNKWLKADETPVLYKELWQKLDELNNMNPVIWCYGTKPKNAMGKLKKVRHGKAKTKKLYQLDFGVPSSKNMESFVITKHWIKANTNNCTPTKNQMKAIGESYPLRSGWLEKLIGKEISAEAKVKFEGYRK